MIRKRGLIIAALFIFVLASPLFANSWELGVSLTPTAGNNDSEYDTTSADSAAEKLVPGFHVGYRFLGILYASWEAMVLPPEYVTDMTATFYETGGEIYYQPGPFRPGFLNLWDVGLKLVLGPIVAHTELGVNNIYVYKQADLEERFESNFGANWRIGLGLKLDRWGVNLDATTIFPSWDSMIDDLNILFGDDSAASDQIADKIRWIPSLTFILYL